MFYQQSETTAAYRWVEFRCFDDDSADAYAPKTGLTFSSGELVWAKAGAAAANATAYASVVEAGNGRYWYPATAAELDTLGKAILTVVKTDVFAEDTTILVVPWDPYSATSLGLTNLDATVSSCSPANMTTALLDLADGIETGMTPRQALRLLCAIVGGQTEGADTNSEKFLAAVANHKIRATVTLVGSDRSSVAVDLD